MLSTFIKERTRNDGARNEASSKRDKKQNQTKEAETYRKTDTDRSEER